MYSGFFVFLMEMVSLINVVVYNWTVSQHAPEMMHDLSPVPCVVPKPTFRKERICNQRAHQGAEPDKKVQSLQKSREDKLFGLIETAECRDVGATSEHL